MSENNVKKILILTLGTGRLAENKEAGYQSTQYVINGKKYQKNDVDAETNFVAEPIIDSFVPDEIFMLGTVTSNWYQFYASAITESNEDESYKVDAGYNRLIEIKQKGSITTSTKELKEYSKEITDIFSPVEKWVRYPRHIRDNHPKIHILLTKYGINEEELKENYIILKQIENSLGADKAYEVAFDVTHSFRSLPIYNLTIFNYIRNITKYNLTISHVYYGMVEVKRENQNNAPIVDLVDIVKIFNLTNGVAEFKDTGNAISLFSMLDDTDPVKSALRSFDLATQLNAFDKVKETLGELYSTIQTDADEERYTGIREMIDIVLKNRFFEDDGIDQTKLNEISDVDLKFCLAKWFFNQNRIGLGLATGLETLRDMFTPAFMSARGIVSADTRGYRENAESYFITIAQSISGSADGSSGLNQTVRRLGGKLRRYKDIRNMFAHSLSSPIREDAEDTEDLNHIKDDVDHFKTDFYELKRFYDEDRGAFDDLFVSSSSSGSSRLPAVQKCRVILDCQGCDDYSSFKRSSNGSYAVYYLDESVRNKIFNGINGTNPRNYPAAEKAYFLCEYLEKNLKESFQRTNIIFMNCNNSEREFIFRLYLENLCNGDPSRSLQYISGANVITNYRKLRIIIDSEEMRKELADKAHRYSSIMTTGLSECT